MPFHTIDNFYDIRPVNYRGHKYIDQSKEGNEGQFTMGIFVEASDKKHEFLEINETILD